jgi:hypothetical protein
VELLAQIVVRAVEVYLVMGAAFAVPFAWLGLRRVDPAAASSTWGFRLILLPGAAALWPFLLLRWIAGTPPPEERTAHRAAARGDAT